MANCGSSFVAAPASGPCVWHWRLPAGLEFMAMVRENSPGAIGGMKITKVWTRQSLEQDAWDLPQQEELRLQGSPGELRACIP